MARKYRVICDLCVKHDGTCPRLITGMIYLNIPEGGVRFSLPIKINTFEDRSQVEETVVQLHRVGVNRVKVYIEGGMLVWRAAWLRT